MDSSNHALYWTWCIRGIGGVLRIMESLLQDKCEPTSHQTILLEFQAARLERIFNRATLQHARLDSVAVRSVDQINAVRSFGSEEVLDN